MTVTHITEREQALQRENERYLKTINIQAVTIEVMQAEIAASERNLEQLTDDLSKMNADAARYQWLRRMHDVCDDEITLWHVRGDDGQPINFGRLDAAIDAAMKETK